VLGIANAISAANAIPLKTCFMVSSQVEPPFCCSRLRFEYKGKENRGAGLMHGIQSNAWPANLPPDHVRM
jgi:hypothetical protein